MLDPLSSNLNSFPSSLDPFWIMIPFVQSRIFVVIIQALSHSAMSFFNETGPWLNGRGITIKEIQNVIILLEFFLDKFGSFFNDVESFLDESRSFFQWTGTLFQEHPFVNELGPFFNKAVIDFSLSPRRRRHESRTCSFYRWCTKSVQRLAELHFILFLAAYKMIVSALLQNMALIIIICETYLICM